MSGPTTSLAAWHALPAPERADLLGRGLAAGVPLDALRGEGGRAAWDALSEEQRTAILGRLRSMVAQDHYRATLHRDKGHTDLAGDYVLLAQAVDALILLAEAPPPTETGYTRAALADGVDRAHALLHEATDSGLPDGDERGAGGVPAFVFQCVAQAHDILHAVGAGLERVGCATADPEAQAILADLIDARNRPIPCGHTLADLVYGVADLTGLPSVTKCGACLGERQKAKEAAEARRAEEKIQGMARYSAIDTVKKYPGCTAVDVERKQGLSLKNAERALQQLAEEGRIRSTVTGGWEEVPRG